MIGLMMVLLIGNIAMNVNVNNSVDKRLTALEIKYSPPITAEVTATMYNAVEAQCDADPLVTAGNYKINPKKATQQKYVALSRNLLKRWGGKYSYGNKIRISGVGHKDGVYIVADTMNKRYKNHIDILETAGTNWYKYTNVVITKIS